MSSYANNLFQASKKDDFNIVSFLNQLDDTSLFEFVLDVLTDNHDNIRPAFPPFKGMDTDELAFEALRNLPYSTYQKVRNFLETIFSNAIENKYPNKDKVIKRIIALTARRKEGLSSIYILDCLNSPKVSEELKIQLSILLSKLENTVPLSFWVTDVDLKETPFLTPAVISAYKNADPTKALSVLSSIYSKPSNFNLYKKPVETALQNLLIKSRELKKYNNLLATMPEWVKREFNSIIHLPEFERNRISEEIDKIRQNKTEITIGISLFPDLLLLIYAYRKGFFSGHKNYSFNIKIVEWNMIFNYLIDGKLDFIIANRDICEEQNFPAKYYDFILPFIEYRGFSILIQKGSSLQTYAYFKGIFENESWYKILKTTLMQFRNYLNDNNKLKFFASKNTDHYKTLERTLNLVGLNLSDFEVISDKEPHDGYELFANKEVDVFVGGFPQRLLALKAGAQELLSQNESEIPFTQINGLICLSRRTDALEEPRQFIIYQWFRAAKEMSKNPEKLDELVEIYNEQMQIVESIYHPLDLELFKIYWKKVFVIPSSNKEISQLSNSSEMENRQNILKEELNKIKD